MEDRIKKAMVAPHTLDKVYKTIVGRNKATIGCVFKKKFNLLDAQRIGNGLNAKSYGDIRITRSKIVVEYSL